MEKKFKLERRQYDRVLQWFEFTHDRKKRTEGRKISNFLYFINLIERRTPGLAQKESTIISPEKAQILIGWYSQIPEIVRDEQDERLKNSLEVFVHMSKKG